MICRDWSATPAGTWAGMSVGPELALSALCLLYPPRLSVDCLVGSRLVSRKTAGVQASTDPMKLGAIRAYS